MERQPIAASNSSGLLRHFREQFTLEKDEVYLCGHSLGAMPKAIPDALNDFLLHQWGKEKVKAWNVCEWFDFPQQLGAQLAAIVGAAKNEILVADSISVNLFKLLVAGLRIQKNRSLILTEADNFPADLYIAEGIGELFPRVQLILCERNELPTKIQQYGEQIALVMLTHTSYGNSELFDMQALTQLVHREGALVLFDLAHSASIMPLALSACQVDLAVGCTYKYLNGGPGSPAFLYAAERLQHQLQTPLTGWWGHAAPFAFESRYRRASGMRQFVCGTQPILSFAALKASLQLLNTLSMAAVREQSQSVSSVFIEPMASHCKAMLLASPANAEERGGHVTYCHSQAYAISRALLAHHIIVDYRAPNRIRFGFPAYVNLSDVTQTVTVLSEILTKRLYEQPQYHQKTCVT